MVVQHQKRDLKNLCTSNMAIIPINVYELFNFDGLDHPLYRCRIKNNEPKNAARNISCYF